MINNLTPAEIGIKETVAVEDRRNSGWDIQNAPKNYFSLVLTQGGGAFFSFASVLLITRNLGSEGYGAIIAIIAASQIAQMLVNWSTLAVSRFGIEEFVETEKISRIFWVRLFIFLLNATLVVATSTFWFPLLANWLKLSPEIFWLLIFHFIATALWIHIQLGLQAIKMLRLYGRLLTIERLIIFASLLVLAAVGKLTVTTSFLCYLILPVFMSFVGFWYLRNFVFTRFSADWKYWRKILFFSLPLIPTSLTGYFSTSYLDAAFISNFLSIRDLGIYSVATQINGIALTFPTLVNSLLIPLFVTLQQESNAQKSHFYFNHILPTLILFWGLFCTIISFVGYFIIPVIFGADFINAIQPLWILLATSTLMFPLLAGYGALVSATSTTYIAMLGAIFAALSNICFNFLLIPRFGLYGCAWATSIMYLTISLTFGVLLRRAVKLPISWIFVAAIPSIAGALVLSLTGNPYLSLLITVVLTIFLIYLKRTSLRKTLVSLREVKNAKGKELSNQAKST